MDVDGVLTDGTIYIDAGGREIKAFHALDGAGIKYLHRAGLKSAVISGRSSDAVAIRMKELGVEEVHQKAHDKIEAYESIRERQELSDEEVAFIADDLTDIPLMRRIGFPIAVANAHEEVKNVADYVTVTPGGHGAVREVIEKMLKAQDKWAAVVKRYGI